MGVDSGLPDFRGHEGFWNAYPGLRQANINFQDIASPDTFRNDPRLAWGFYGHRLKLYRDTEPHQGFAILREIAQEMQHGAYVYTSNVDGQFQKAGFSPFKVVECHGSIHQLQCVNACTKDIWPSIDFFPEVDIAHCRLLNNLPHCPGCGGVSRPNLLMFGDCDWMDARSREQQANLDAWLLKVKRLVIIELGAGTALPWVRHFGEFQDGFMIRINPKESQLPAKRRGIGLTMTALDALKQIREAWWELG
jgi:NAD-dependent SIR2 family protein deacetylase